MTFTRRELLKTGAGLGAASLAGLRPAPAQDAALIERVIPSTGETLRVIGLGARNFRGGWGQRSAYLATIRAFADLGGQLIDTAPAYGDSETIIGDVVSELGLTDDLFLASKVERRGRENGLGSIENSIHQLRAGTLDLLQVQSLVDVETQLETLFELKAEGRIRYVGATVWLPRGHRRLAEIIDRGEPLDFIQADYSLDNRLAAERLLPLAADRGIAVIVNLPFGRGRLFETTQDEPLPEWAASIDCSSWAQVFLKYIVANPSVTCVIPGTTREEHVIDNLGAARGRLPDAALRRIMEAFIDELD